MKTRILFGDIGDDPPKSTLYYGRNAIDSLRELPADSISMACTSPPYWGLRDYKTTPQVWGGEPGCEHEWGDGLPHGRRGNRGVSGTGGRMNPPLDEIGQGPGAGGGGNFCSKCSAWRGQLGLEPSHLLYVEHLVLLAREIRRVLHPTGTFWLNLGDSYMSHVARDFSGLGGREGERLQNEDGYGESIIIGKPKVEGLKDKDLVGIPWRAALALQDDGWWLRNAIIWHKTNAMPHSVTDRFTCKYELVFLFAKQARYFFDLDAVRVPHTYGQYDAEGQFTPAQNWYEEGEGERKMDQTDGQLGTLAGSPRRFGRGVFNVQGKNPGDVWSLATAQYKGGHFAVWPEALVERMIKAGTSEKGRCPACKTPWRRVVEKETPVDPGRGDESKLKNADGLSASASSSAKRRLGQAYQDQLNESKRVTVGWEPGCECASHEPERCVVLDPFSGSATTGDVAMKLGRDYIGLDLNADYLKLAEARLTDRPPPTAASEAPLITDIFGSDRGSDA